MASWYTDEGLARLDREWKAKHPGAVVYHIGDLNHSTNPDVSQHAPDRGGSQPGDDKGEVDGSDFMPGKGGVTEEDLDELAEGLRESRDPRILIVIRRQRIFSSKWVGGVAPFTWRTYGGKYHGHTHVSVNDKFDNNQSDWKWEKVAARTRDRVKIDANLPVYLVGDEDADWDGWDHISRAQALMNLLDGDLPDLDTDGVYGAKTAQKLARVLKDAKVTGTTSNGTKLGEAEWRRLYGI